MCVVVLNYSGGPMRYQRLGWERWQMKVGGS